MNKRYLFGTLGFVIIIICWFAGSVIAGGYMVPAPWITLVDSLQSLLQLNTWYQLAVTLARVAAGFSAAFIAGTLLGLLTGRRELEYLFRPAIMVMQGVPPILWTIPLILILGYSKLTPVVVIALICLPLVTLNVGEGMRTVPPELGEMLRVFAPGTIPKVRELILPHLKPFFTASLRLGITLGLKASVVAEYFGATNGIGFQLQSAYQAFQVRRLFSWAFILVILILFVDWVSRNSSLVAGRIRRRHVHIDSAAFSVTETNTLRNRTPSVCNNAYIVAKGITFGYRSEQVLIAEAELSVKTGEVAVVHGDSGIGKTTLLYLLAGLRTPGRGTIRRPERLGFVFQDDRFLPWKSCEANVALPLRYLGYSRKVSLSFARTLLREVGLEGKEMALPEELSGGMKKRLAFARCFSCYPAAVFMDEPFSGLHKSARAALWKKLINLVTRYPVPVVIVTHFPEEVPPSLSAHYYRMKGNPAILAESVRDFPFLS